MAVILDALRGRFRFHGFEDSFFLFSSDMHKRTLEKLLNSGLKFDIEVSKEEGKSISRLRCYRGRLFSFLATSYIILYSFFMKLLGIDYGTKRIGFAVGDTDQKIAFPRDVVEGRAKYLDYVDRMIDQEGVSLVVMGIPMRHNGEEGELAGEIRAFAHEITEKLDVDVVFQNEILSTKAIQKGTVAKNKTDAASAALILQSYLDRIMS